MSEDVLNSNPTREAFTQLEKHMVERIIGQSSLIRNMLVTLLADGHLLVEGAPGLAKTTAIKALADGIESSFHRIQFTPDLLPADLTGTEIYRPQDGSFHFQQGPLFHNILLADEINRAPAKVQSALLEAMGERQVTVGSETYLLPQLFLVMATQNPLEHEGTYPLPEAQLDRFLMYINVDYPDVNAEHAILNLVNKRERGQLDSSTEIEIPQRISEQNILSARVQVMDMYMADSLQEYIIQIVIATRNPAPYGAELSNWVRYGASPRATLALDRCSRAHAWLAGRDYVSPEDVHAVARDVLRHRILLSFEAQAEGVTPTHLIDTLLARVPVP